ALVALEIRDQHFDAALGTPRAGLADRVRENRRAAVLQVVAVDGRDDDVAQAEGLDGLTDADGFFRIRGGRTSVGDRAVRAGARADVAEDHERGRSVVPAFADV